jgi:hypothetical protein
MMKYQHQLPENVEQEEVEREENAQHAGLQQHEHRVVFLHALLNRRPGAEHRDEAHQRGQHHQQHADAVHTNVVAHAERGNPTDLFFELISRRALLEPRHQRQRDQEGRE